MTKVAKSLIRSLAILVVVWTVSLLVFGSIKTAVIVTVVYLLVGAAGFFYT